MYSVKQSRFACTVALLLVATGTWAGAGAADRVTILADAFTRRADLTPTWGFSALVEFRGKRILFDTGGDEAPFINNARQLHVDLTKLDMVAISHRHGDHTAGLRYVLSLNPGVPVYVPADVVFGGDHVLSVLSHPNLSLPADMRYFGGRPLHPPIDSPWAGANLVYVTEPMTIAPGVRLLTTTSEKKGTLEMPEVSMVLDTPAGEVVIVGCSHPGILKILAGATAGGGHVREMFGGIHELSADDVEVTAVVDSIVNDYKVDVVALGHCTGEVTFGILKRRLGERNVYAGLGERVPF
jgi:7,8-dihydropterin-6-yl-methyl-4-(beta-D-ribofuranosyl)aminobenzene 5'-phosphate synthase